MKRSVGMPDYTTLSRRLKHASRSIAAKIQSGKPIHVVVDSTGLKVFGEGEWKVRQHGSSKRRTWMKLHLAVNESSNQILSVVLTDNSYKDNEVFEELMCDIDADVGQATGDGAYDAKNCWDWSEENHARGVFPPRKGAKLKSHGNAKGKPSQRDKHIQLRRDIGKKAMEKEDWVFPQVTCRDRHVSLYSYSGGQTKLSADSESSRRGHSVILVLPVGVHEGNGSLRRPFF